MYQPSAAEIGTVSVIALGVVSLLGWAFKTLIAMSERRIVEVAKAVTETGSKMATSIDGLTKSVNEMGADIREMRTDIRSVKESSELTAMRVEQIAISTGEVTPPPYAVPMEPSRRNGR